MGKRGRPSKGTEENLAKALLMAKEGKTEAQIAKAIGATTHTIHNWKNKDKDFFDALKKSKAISDQNVERSLYERACGYSHPAVKINVLKDGTVIEVPYIEHYPPDTTACIFWLKNRQPEKWRDKHEISGSLSLEERLFKLTEKRNGGGS